MLSGEKPLAPEIWANEERTPDAEPMSPETAQ